MTTPWHLDPDYIGEGAAILRLLGDRTRLQIVGLLQPGEMNVSALCSKLDLAQPTVSHHLGLLKSAELLKARRQGKEVYYSLNPGHVTIRPNGAGIEVEAGGVRLEVGVRPVTSGAMHRGLRERMENNPEQAA